jgi:hypothetical protein
MVNTTNRQQNSYEDCPNQRERLEELVEFMRDLRNQLNQARAEYKQQLYKCLNQQNPFPTNGTLDDDIRQYIRLVGYCLSAGDVDILKKWGMEPIERNLSLLAEPGSLEEYCDWFDDLLEEGEEDLEKTCFRALKSFFSNLANQGFVLSN